MDTKKRLFFFRLFFSFEILDLKMTLLKKLNSCKDILMANEFQRWSERNKTNGTTCNLLRAVKDILDLISCGESFDLLKDLLSESEKMEIGSKTKKVYKLY
jgi:hypothetical protein